MNKTTNDSCIVTASIKLYCVKRLHIKSLSWSANQSVESYYFKKKYLRCYSSLVKMLKIGLAIYLNKILASHKVNIKFWDEFIFQVPSPNSVYAVKKHGGV